MLKTAYFGFDSSRELEKQVNNFLTQNLRVISVTPFATSTWVRCQILYEVDGSGSQLVKTPTRPAAPYTEPDGLDTTRSE